MEFSVKELRGKNTMLDRVQRQQDNNYSKSLLKFNEERNLKLKDGNIYNGLKIDKEIISNLKEPIRVITKAELGKKRSMLR